MSWSLSSLGLFEKCQLKYRFKYIDKLPEARGTAANRGVELHKVVEEFVIGTIDVLPPEINFYTQFLTGIRQHEKYPEHKISVNKEWEPVEWKDGWYRGILDLKVLGKEANGTREATVYDWKTGKIYPDHDDQKSIYSLGVFSEHPTVSRVRAIHVYLDLGQSREKVYDRAEVQQLRDHWNSRASFLERTPPEDMIPNPGFHCRYCAFSRAKGGPCRF